MPSRVHYFAVRMYSILFLLQVFGAEVPEDTSFVQILFPLDAARRRNRDSCLPAEPALADIVRGRDNFAFDFY